MEFLFSLTAGISSILFGIIATLSEYRDKTGRVKASAIWVIVGIACSAALGIVANELSASSSAIKTAQRHELLLRSLWENQNKTEAAAIKALLNITYASGVGEAPPLIFDNSWVCRINGEKIKSGLIVPENKKVTWSDQQQLSKPDFSLKGNLVEIDRTEKKTVDDNQYVQTNYITEFTITNENPMAWQENFGIITDWNNLSLELIFESSYDKDFGRWHKIIKEGDWGTDNSNFWNKQFQNYYDTKKYSKMPDFSITPLPCEINATIYIGDRALKKIKAIPAVIRTYDEDVSRTIIASFPIINLSENYFPDFKSADKDSLPNSNKNTMPLIIGYILLLIIILSFINSIMKYHHLVSK